MITVKQLNAWSSQLRAVYDSILAAEWSDARAEDQHTAGAAMELTRQAAMLIDEIAASNNQPPQPSFPGARRRRRDILKDHEGDQS